MVRNGVEERSGRETRLLLLVVAVALAVLLLLARFQFPGSEITTAAPSVAPLSGLVARATFDEMAEIMSGVLTRVSPSVVIVRLEPIVPEPSARGARGRRGGPAAGGALPPPPPPRLVPAVRVRGDLALLSLPDGMRAVAAPGLDTPIDLVATDAERRLALVRTTGRTGPDALAGSLRSFGGFSFVALIDATPTGPTVEPFFIGRADPLIDTRWPQALTGLAGRAVLPEGTVLFSIGGRFIGLVTMTEGGPAIIPMPAIEDVVRRLAAEAGGRP